ncbi:DUF5684 domain-containing protein [Microbacterium sp. NPDC057650]|uniref:DUF5684 domain-containing protein n=1 Tax=unclassified Microbacterium TaxID=2609290 RepID=UPI00366C9F3C
MIHAADVTDAVDSLWGSLFGGATGFVMLAVYVLVVVGLWKVFTKAGYPGILAIIPIVNTIFIVKIAGFSGWMTLLYLIPIVNIVFAIIVAIKLGANFGKGGAFSFFLLWLFPFIGYLILGFGGAKYSRA